MAKTAARTSSPILSDPAGEAGGSLGAERVRALEAERQSLVSLLNILRSGEPATRLDLEREAHLGRAVVVDRLTTLAAFGLIDEGGVGRSIGGRAPRLVRFRPDAGRVLVANIDVDTIGVGLADLSGKLMVEHYEDFDFTASTDSLFERLETLFSWVSGQDGARLWAIGLGVPGVVEERSDLHLAIPKLGARPAVSDQMLLERLIHRFKVPIWARTAVQMETMGEIGVLPRERGREMLYVDLGSEISAGVVIGGRLQRGSQGIAGQVGHAYAGEAYTQVCGCGNVGCLRTVAGCEAIEREGLLGARGGHSPLLAETLARTGDVTVADVGTAARRGDPFSAELLAKCGRMIGTVLSTLVNVLNPAMVVIGGELAQTGDICLAAIREGIYRHAQPLISRDLSIVRSRMGRSAGLVGAATVAVTEIFAPAFVEDWITAGSPLAHPRVVDLLAEAELALAAAS